MTGPKYPPALPVNTAPGGQLKPRERFDVWTTIISQYANSPILTQLLRDLAKYLDQRSNLDAFYDLIWNVDTAQGYGLDVWGRIVGVNRVVTIQNASYFGFQESEVEGSTAVTNFNDATTPANTDLYNSFFSGQTITSNFTLSDDTFRTLIFAKAMANITDGSIPAINQILLNLFPGRGNCFVTEPAPGFYFGFQEATSVQPTYIRSWNFAQIYIGEYLGFAEALPGDAAFGQAPLFQTPSWETPGSQANALAGPLYSGQTLAHMVMTYTFDFALSPVELAIVQQSGVLPKPVGVAASIVINQQVIPPPSAGGGYIFNNSGNSALI